MTSRNFRVKLTSPPRVTHGHKSRTPPVAVWRSGSWCRTFISVCNQPLKANSAFHPSGVGKWVGLPASSHQPGPLSAFECDVIYGRPLYHEENIRPIKWTILHPIWIQWRHMGVTRGGNWWCHRFFPLKNWWPFLQSWWPFSYRLSSPHRSHLPMSVTQWSCLNSATKK